MTEQQSPRARVGYEKEVQELVELAEKPHGDPEKMQRFLEVRSILAAVRPALNNVFVGLFDKRERLDRDVRVFLGRMREELSGQSLTREEYRLLQDASDTLGFHIIRKFIEDKILPPPEKPPVTERVIREIPAPDGKGGHSICCPNIGGLPTDQI